MPERFAAVHDQRHHRALALLALLPFAAAAQESSVLTWCHDGANVGGFRLYAGPQPDFARMTQMGQVLNGAARTGTIDGLRDGVWFFAVTAVSPTAVESAPSNIVGENSGPTACAPVVATVPGPVRNLVVTPVTPTDPTTRQPFARLQSAGGVGSVSLPAAPRAGNMLLLTVGHRQSAGGAPTVPAGWTQRVLRTTTLTDVQSRRGIAAYTKTATAADRTVAASWAGTAFVALHLAEYPAGWTLVSAASADTGTASVPPLNVQAGGAGRGSVCLGLWRSAAGAIPGIAWTGMAGAQSFVLPAADPSPVVLGNAYGSAAQCALTWSGAGHEASAAALVFE